ncbi:hypothetical protein BV22DRAFT_1030728 [Leucogyrophana mollusca]|uniref:Uncharacterized protein n=1 Tax=Leucogyrophana mollusca TaxID=85980 RepID=A0ACB8BUB0_9AGAM|nr:hypothetical protein BV22DRAFT_1030728 [Leucogyrophana mollusca]
MATVTHYIRSHYDPKDRERLERETGQIPDEESDPWQTESSLSSHRRLVPPPAFVPATLPYDEWGRGTTPETRRSIPQNPPEADLAAWYRSLTAASERSPQNDSNPPQRPSSAPATGPKPRAEATTKNNWFIKRVLQSEPSTAPSTPPPSLADILARDPPPLPSEPQYVPPVWLAIGPSNRGFGMLQRSGWNEGEGLGAHIHRSRDYQLGVEIEETKPRIKPTRTQSTLTAAMSDGNVDSDVEELRKVDIIDLTLSDSDGDSDDDAFPQVSPPPAQGSINGPSREPHAQKSLLTPLPTVLKSDRLGIGLKAKTEGPYKASKKRVTHNAAALAAHIKSAEEMRRKKAEVGRGRRGFAKARKREEESRKQMLAYLNE